MIHSRRNAFHIALGQKQTSISKPASSRRSQDRQGQPVIDDLLDPKVKSIGSRRLQYTRSHQGGTLPFVVFSLSTTVAMLAVSVDVMRTIHCASILQNSAQSAALYALRGAFTEDGELRPGPVENNIAQALSEVNGSTGSAWFNAPAGPSDDGSSAQTPVMFEPQDMIVSTSGNTGNPGDLLLTLKARRDGADGLKLKLLPLIYAFNSMTGQPIPQGIDQANPYRVAEVCLQPATRIGAGNSGSFGLVRSNFANPQSCATFPVALSNLQWQTAVQPSQTNLIYTIKIAGSKSGTSSTSASEISGCFVNLTPSGNSDYYGAAAGSLAVSQLYENLAAFSNESPVSLSAAVEKDSRVSAFDSNSQEFTSRAKLIAARLNRAVSVQPGRFYILPVLAQNPLINQKNRVIGFSRMRLIRAIFDSTDNSISLEMEIGQSRPMANASIGTRLAAIPATNGATIQPSDSALNFAPRSFTQSGLAALPRGMVMAPALSPRSIAGGGI